ncbi:endoplasmic reticulum protein [Cantharellus anzutake]|uniref:endoplasmic reticulum protein n=1 Tax=Cantharellus anzutake TaxID=1750568 RepID=UPI001907FF4D|nr:endoplasmic reticulum protein [Cantharellus anzutake]KAF8333015.1 endoplasmic reticulum protein [Cantharellus anzutake]
MPASLNYADNDNNTLVKSLPSPPGFSEGSLQKSASASHSAAAASYAKLKQQRAWDLAISPAKSLPMNAFMLYMSGGGVQIFSIGILAMLLLNPIKAVSSMNTSFVPYAPSLKSSDSLILPKIVYILCNILTLALGIWKCRSMGLLPTGTGDWLAFETRGPPPEISLVS